MFSRLFWKAAFERAVKTAVQSFLAVGLVGATDLFSVDWEHSLSVAGLAALISVLTSLVSSKVRHGGPSLTSERLG